MKYCGIELKSNEARIISIVSDGAEFHLIASDIKKIKLEDPKTQEAAKSFKEAFAIFFESMSFDKSGLKNVDVKAGLREEQIPVRWKASCRP